MAGQTGEPGRPAPAYGNESARTHRWFDTEVTKYHRKVSSHVAASTAAGLTVVALAEPQPTAALLERRPDFALHLVRPPLLLLAAVKPGG